MCPYQAVSQRLDQGIMEWNLYRKIADEAAAERWLSLMVYELHNEPLLDKRIFECIKYFKLKNGKKYTSLITNGELLDRFSQEEIIQSQLDRLMISLNSHSKEVFESVNIGLDYERVQRNISSLLMNENLRRKMAFSFVVIKQNANDVLTASRYWRQQGIKTRIISQIANRAGTLDNFKKLKLDSRYGGTSAISRVWRKLMYEAGQIVGCHLPFYQMNILFNGDVIICCHDWNRATIVGNARTNSLREIWNSKKMNEVRSLLLRKRYNLVESCNECSLVR